jgi:hypothetical protein
MNIIQKIQSKQINPDKVKQKLAEKRFQAARSVVIKSLPSCIKQGYKEQKDKGINPTVNSIFADISRENLDFYHEMKIEPDYIREVIKKVIDSESAC